MTKKNGQSHLRLWMIRESTSDNYVRNRTDGNFLSHYDSKYFVAYIKNLNGAYPHLVHIL